MTPKNTITLKAQFGLVLNWAFIAQSGRRLLVIIVMNILLKKLWNILSGRQTEVKERLLIQWFFLQDYACLRAYSGTEAVMLLGREQPDLIILDLMLPGLSGEDVLKKIVGIPVIVVSAKAGVDDKVALLLHRQKKKCL